MRGANPDEDIVVKNTEYWMGSDITVATATQGRVRAYGRVWDFDGRSAEICQIDWSGPAAEAAPETEEKREQLMTFKALIVDKDEDGKTHASIENIDVSRLPEADVTVAVEYSTLNYKDGLCLGPEGDWFETIRMCPASTLPEPSRKAPTTGTSRATRWY